jgi:hypothetical protein
MPFVAHPAIRNRGTIGGSLAHADPAAELPAVMVALNARFGLRSSKGMRTVSADDFFVGLFTTAVEPGELLTEITIPKAPARTGFAFRKYRAAMVTSRWWELPRRLPWMSREMRGCEDYAAQRGGRRCSRGMRPTRCWARRRREAISAA